ncbi:obscurin-like [Channa argus]|uniref:obscurin-like n=1 Tax=Channa argus TaxID=215402 RepID=UPI003521D611
MSPLVDPSVELLVVPSEESGPQKLSCSGSGFNPQIQWFFETQQRSSSTNDISVAADGRVTVTSQLHVPQAEWKTGKVFTCEVSDRPLSPNVRKDISFCSVHSASPPSIHVETPSFKTVMMATSVVTATCSVQSDFDAKVTWLMDGRAAQSNTVTQDRNMTIIISTLRVSSSQWKGLNNVTCRAEHKCFSTTEKTVDVAGPAVTAPTVEIRRSLPDLLKGNSVVLVCDVTQLSSSDLYITFQANNADISEKLYVDLPESPGPYSVSRTFSVPSNHWKKGTSFTCTVNQGFSRNFKSQSTGNIFVDPSVELLVVPSEESGPQKLSCSGSGINAQIQWFSETQQRSSSTKDISVGSDGRVTVTSQLHVPQAEWKTGKVFTCEVSERSSSPKVRKDISFCSVHSASPPSIHVETPSFKTVMMATSEVTATCSVQSDFDAKVTWLMDGRAAQSNTVTQDRNMTIIISTLRVSSSQWKQLNRVTCRAEHKCFSTTEKTVDVAGPAVTAPTVEIRRSLPDLLKGNSVVLVCDVTQLSSSDLYITFQANNADISEKLYVDLPESPGPHSVSRTFSVPSNHWKKGTSFTCTVNQGFSRNFKSQSTGNIFVDPSVELLVVPSEESGPQKLSCSGSGINAQIQWFSETQQRSSSTKDISVGADGRVTVTSQLHVPQAEWKTGKVFTCEVSERSSSPKVRKDISFCSVHSASPPSIHVETPSFKTVMMATSEVTATCSVQSDFDAKVTWLMDGRAAQSNTVTQDRNMTIIISTLRVSSSQWKQLKRVTCRAEHKCFSTTEKTVDVAGPAVTAPSVEIRRSLPDLLKGNSVVLVCDVTQLSSSDLYITFQANNADISEKLYVDLPESPGPYSVSRTFSVPSNHWKKGTNFTCTVNQGFSTNFKSQSTGNIFGERSSSFFP